MTSPLPVGRLAALSLDCPDPSVLAAFYGALLGLAQAFANDDGSFVALADGDRYLTFVRVDDHAPPTWPLGDRPQQMHLDLAVTDLDAAVAGAVALGARLADQQARPDSWRVLLDPAGHPFCVTTLIP